MSKTVVQTSPGWQPRSLFMANVDFNSGDGIMVEKPLVVGPTRDSSTLCVGCYDAVNGSVLCSKCRWPVCNTVCETQPWHKDYECMVFSRAKTPYQHYIKKKTVYPNYNHILPLRLLFLKEREASIWNHIATTDNSAALDCLKVEEARIVKCFRQRCDLKQFDEDEIILAYRITKQQSTDFRLDKRCFSCVYLGINLMKQSCLPNVAYVVKPEHDYKIYVWAAVAIKKSEDVTFCRADALSPTYVRRSEMIDKKHLYCTCERCSDPTELGSYIGSLKCPNCKSGILNTVNPLDTDTKYKCDNCVFVYSTRTVLKIYSDAKEEIKEAHQTVNVNRRIEGYEYLIEKNAAIFHIQNSLLTTMKYLLLEFYMTSSNYTTANTTSISLNKKMEFARQLLETYNIVIPGYNRYRARLLLIIDRLIAMRSQLKRSLTKAQAEAQTAEDEELRSKLQDISKVLKPVENFTFPLNYFAV